MMTDRFGEASGKFAMDAMYQAAYGACIQTLAMDPGEEDSDVAADTARKIVKCILDELPEGEYADLSRSIVLAASTGVSCGEELRFRKLVRNEEDTDGTDNRDRRDGRLPRLPLHRRGLLLLRRALRRRLRMG